ncbi:DJ-1/PfpI family protein [Antrihabitans sp. YC3-6]|uniref:DJ-1/PfpI family protein n=1 Tax=Antrihabitans stalagmiti TaxID=2799499 RepID=A0A934U2Z5_9NOCA|nr:DJ-1/PfpI family protein [Antrihabitans stalagmiti]MBJ8339152.1 DJ-1/PfpI family protein [Antrihabitans stalagmiti]
MSERVPRRVSIVIFDGFELLDVFGPQTLFKWLPKHFDVDLVGPTAGPVASHGGIEVVAQHGYADASPGDIVLVPGGLGTRTLVDDSAFLTWLAAFARDAEFVTSVCTGSAVLAAAGLLDGYRATSNKRNYAWASGNGADVTWVPVARWVQDGNRWTSSGIAAGIDMAAALIRFLHGDDVARGVADSMEYETHDDADWDPYARLNSG